MEQWATRHLPLGLCVDIYMTHEVDTEPRA
jgi:hypothetical protein